MRRLLYIKDNEDNLYMLTLFFDVQGGYEIFSAATGAEGISTAGIEQPDLILMDLNLPKIEGWQATRRLKTRRLAPQPCSSRVCAYMEPYMRKRQLSIG